MSAVSRTTPPSSFDAWLQTRLQHLYDETLVEPLPADLLAILARDASD